MLLVPLTPIFLPTRLASDLTGERPVVTSTRVRPQGRGLREDAEFRARRLRRDIGDVTPRAYVDVALQLRRDDRPAAGYPHDGYPQPLLGE